MNTVAVFLALLVCLIPMIESTHKKKFCPSCSLNNGTCIPFGSTWTEGNGIGCFGKKCIREGLYGWRTTIIFAKCRTSNGTCVNPGKEWTSKRDGKCYKNTCLANGKMRIKVKLIQIAC